MTALNIVTNVCERLALTPPSGVFNSTDPQIIQIRGLMNQEGAELAIEYEWQVMRVQTSFNTVATPTLEQTALPADFGWIINDSMWDRSLDRPVSGPLTSQEWQREQAGPTFTSVEFAYRIWNNSIWMTPAPGSGHTVYYEYLSKYWCESSGGVGKVQMTDDADVSKLDEELVTQGTLWRFLKAKGLDYTADLETYAIRKNRLQGQDGGKPSLNLAIPQPRRVVLPNIPEGNWPGNS
jgi:hypothetical protein